MTILTRTEPRFCFQAENLSRDRPCNGELIAYVWTSLPRAAASLQPRLSERLGLRPEITIHLIAVDLVPAEV